MREGFADVPAAAGQISGCNPGERGCSMQSPLFTSPANSPIPGPVPLLSLHLASPVCATKSVCLATRAQLFGGFLLVGHCLSPRSLALSSSRLLSGPAITSRDARMGLASTFRWDSSPLCALLDRRVPVATRPLGWHEREQPIPRWDPAAFLPALRDVRARVDAGILWLCARRDPRTEVI